MISDDARQRSMAVRLANKSAREVAREQSLDGWALFPDSPPGVGWVLAPPSLDKHGRVVPGEGSPRRYYTTRESALDRYWQLTGKPW